LRTIDNNVSDEVASYLYSIIRISNAFDNLDSATTEDVLFVENTLRDRYITTVVAAPLSAHTQLNALKQEKSENLATYYNRASALLRQVGGKDQIGDTPLASNDNFILMTIIRAFIIGIQSDLVRTNTAAQGGFACTGLHKAYLLAQQVSDSLEETKQLQHLAQLQEKARAFDQQQHNRNRPQNQGQVSGASADVHPK
jgi:hypothetical protein